MSEPQPIETAPKDGTVILTELGFCIYFDQRNWGSPVNHGKWVHCDTYGTPFDCADEGYCLCEPRFWMPVPKWIGG